MSQLQQRFAGGRRLDAHQSVAARDPWRIIRGFVIALTLIVLAMRIPLGQGVTVGAVLAVALIPVWATSLRRYWGARVFVLLGIIAFGSGLWLTSWSSSDHASSTVLLVSTSSVLVEIVAGVGVVLWARRYMSQVLIATFFGLGLLISVLSTVSLNADAWKTGFAVPVGVLVLAGSERLRKSWISVVALLALCAISAFADSRSAFALLIISVALYAWQVRPQRHTRRQSAVTVVIGLAALALVVYNLGQTLVLDGYLGADAQQRSLAQIDTSGSLIAGGRPELAATVALMQLRPLGYGNGTLPSLTDILVAKSGMAQLNYEPNNGYVETYMFGGQIELHSVIGDLWARFGIPGLALSILILFLTVWSMSVRITTRRASPLVLFLGPIVLWNLAFGPLLTLASILILSLGLGLTERAPRRDRSLR